MLVLLGSLYARTFFRLTPNFLYTRHIVIALIFRSVNVLLNNFARWASVKPAHYCKVFSEIRNSTCWSESCLRFEILFFLVLKSEWLEKGYILGTIRLGSDTKPANMLYLVVCDAQRFCYRGIGLVHWVRLDRILCMEPEQKDCALNIIFRLPHLENKTIWVVYLSETSVTRCRPISKATELLKIWRLLCHEWPWVDWLSPLDGSVA